METTTIQTELRDFIKENFIVGRSKGEISDTDSLIDSGIVDSTGVLELVMYIEEKYGFKVDDEELIPENLDSVSNLVAFINKKRNN